MLTDLPTPNYTSAGVRKGPEGTTQWKRSNPRAHRLTLRTCHECGGVLIGRALKFCSPTCAAVYRIEMGRLVPVEAKSLAALGAEGKARRARLQATVTARRDWNQRHRDKEEAVQRRRWYVREVQPKLPGLQPAAIMQAIGASRTYARQIIKGQIPHERHFAPLAGLVGVRAEVTLETEDHRHLANRLHKRRQSLDLSVNSPRMAPK